jgi:hypothetical protein
MITPLHAPPFRARRTAGRPGIHRRRRWLVATLAIGAALVACPAAVAQDDGEEPADAPRPAADAGRGAAWAKIEQDVEKNLKEVLRAPGGLDAGARDFIVEKAVPQLANEANRGILDRIRRRVREIFLAGITDDRTFDDASKAIAEAALAVVRDTDASIAARVNAMLLVGDLRGKDGKDGTVWPGAVAPLAAVAADPDIDTAVRVAAMAGLARHADAAKRAGGDKQTEFAKAARGAVLAVAVQPVDPLRPAASEWLSARGLALVTSVTRTAPKEFAASLVKMMSDPARSLDVRVRAAAALGATATAKSEIQAAEAVGAITELAVAVVEAEEGILRDRRYEQGLTAGNSGGGTPASSASKMMSMQITAPGIAGGPAAPVVPQLVPDQALRRTAWRLAALADAILDEEGKTGVASLLSGEDQENSKAYAELYREQALAIDAARTDDSLLAAVATIRPEEELPVAADAPAVKPAATAPESDPFGGK